MANEAVKPVSVSGGRPRPPVAPKQAVDAVVQDLEEKVHEILEEASAQARRIVQDARREAARIRCDARDRARQEADPPG